MQILAPQRTRYKFQGERTVQALPAVIGNRTSLIQCRHPRQIQYAMTIAAKEFWWDPQPQFTFQAVPLQIIFLARDEKIGYDRFGMLTKLEATGIFIDEYF